MVDFVQISRKSLQIQQQLTKEAALAGGRERG
jgi:hypothetical protein